MSTVDFSKINTASAGSTDAAAKARSQATAAQESADRFLTLLVAQLKNQDPLSPMDNAQVTSQIAQINTVSGIEKLNSSVGGLSSQFVRMQALQGAALVGRDVVVAGNRLDIDDKVGQGGFELESAASAVQVQILNGANQVIGTLNLGAQPAGMGSFSWPAGNHENGSGLTFRVSASVGTTALNPTALMQDKVTAVSTQGDALLLELETAGSVSYDKVKALN